MLYEVITEENQHLYQRDVERIVATLFDEITEALARGERVELRGFGAFSRITSYNVCYTKLLRRKTT